MKKYPKVSVLMSTYNCSEFIDEAINSVLCQDYENIEFIICDDNSTDDTIEKIKTYLPNDKIKFFQNEVNKGLVVTRNFMFSKLTGDYITFLDADDVSEKNRIKVLVEKLLESGSDIVGSNAVIIDEKGKVINETNYPEEIKNIDTIVEKQIPIFIGRSILLKKEILKSIKGYSLLFDRIGSEDVDFIYRTIIDFKFCNVEQNLYKYRMTMDSLSRTSFTKNPTSLFSHLLAKDLYFYRKKNGNNCSEEKEYFESIKNQYLEQYTADKYAFYSKELFNLGIFNQRLKIIAFMLEIPFKMTSLKSKVKLFINATLFVTFGYALLSKLRKILAN
jgi:glycosyltransferase involved in cell wall biosynthesis